MQKKHERRPSRQGGISPNLSCKYGSYIDAQQKYIDLMDSAKKKHNMSEVAFGSLRDPGTKRRGST